MPKINATPKNQKSLKKWAAFAIAEYSPLMGWLLFDSNGDLSLLGKNEYSRIFPCRAM